MKKNHVYHLDLKDGDIIVSNGQMFEVNHKLTINPVQPTGATLNINGCLDGANVNIKDLDSESITGMC